MEDIGQESVLKSRGSAAQVENRRITGSSTRRTTGRYSLQLKGTEWKLKDIDTGANSTDSGQTKARAEKQSVRRSRARRMLIAPADKLRQKKTDQDGGEVKLQEH
ncbi:unnamed protein product [Pleuronectes platessa]|uniref:Uncharacterized protein n=1 Tax=Pleuronectes platessa TaxID=8262 RepID=A0A9N7UL14_PLEPL|nr:unnamed protein product [Pleuronectes platessa]